MNQISLQIKPFWCKDYLRRQEKECVIYEKTVNVFACVEPEVKEQAEKVLDWFGISIFNVAGMF